MSGVSTAKTIFITGGTGYMGKRLIRILLQRGYQVIALVRKGSEQKIPEGAKAITANPFDPASFQSLVPANSIFIQLLGVAHPSPKKKQQFYDIDLRSVKASADAASAAGISHFIYVSVARLPVRFMAVYQAVRKEGEEYCLEKKLNCTFIRPWYVLGPGHWWPVLLYPFYGLAALIPAWRNMANAFALITIKQMLASLATAVETEPQPLRIVEIKDIRQRTKNENR
jgi:uncharacterized protein YbjT (DUF2867 family)